MNNSFVASCKRGLGRVRNKADLYARNRKYTIHLKGGGQVTVYGLSRVIRHSLSLEEEFQREGLSSIRTNIAQERNLSFRSQIRDAYLEKVLRSEEYKFPDMYMARNPFGEAPLTALILFVTEMSCSVHVTVKGDVPETDYSYELPFTKYHRVPILGLYPKRKNMVLIELCDEQGVIIDSRTVPVKTKDLPSDLHNIIEVKKESKDPAFDQIMISGGIDIKTCAFDKKGKIRYFLRRKVKGYGIFPLSNGRFFYMEKEISIPSYSNPQCTESYDMDYLGRVYKTYLTEKGVHHTVEEKQDGNILAGSNTMMEHTEDMVIEIDRQTGEIVWSVSMEELFDDTYQDMMDWAHVNSAAYCPKDNTVIVSLRNVHSILSIDYETKKLRWLLSDPEFWKARNSSMVDKLLKPVGDIAWTYQQHAAFELDEDFDGNPDTKHIIVFDNHWAKRRRAESFDNDELTYVSFYTVNEKEGTVSLYRRFPCPKARIRSNGIYVPEKRRVYSMAGSYTTPIGGNAGGVYEFDFDTGEVLGEYGVKPGFFRAYEFAPDMEELAKPLPKDPNYMCGNLKRPRLMPEDESARLKPGESRRVSSSKVKYILEEDLLFVRGVDHDIRKVYFLGEKGNYVVDFDDTYQTMEIFKKTEYFISMQIDKLPSDHYQVYLDLNGELQDTGKYIEK